MTRTIRAALVLAALAASVGGLRPAGATNVDGGCHLTTTGEARWDVRLTGPADSVVTVESPWTVANVSGPNQQGTLIVHLRAPASVESPSASGTINGEPWSATMANPSRCVTPPPVEPPPVEPPPVTPPATCEPPDYVGEDCNHPPTEPTPPEAVPPSGETPVELAPPAVVTAPTLPATGADSALAAAGAALGLAGVALVRLGGRRRDRVAGALRSMP
jgi:hypothetical protein